MKKQIQINKVYSKLAQGIKVIQKMYDKHTTKARQKIENNKYLRLMRLHQPTGFLLLVLPCLWMIGFASNSFVQITKLSVLFVFGAILVRSAGCIINDICDYKFDRLVERTKNRPIASGEVSIKQAIVLVLCLLFAALLILLTLPISAIYLGLFSIIPIILYPLMKRYTYFPQIFLGFVFNIGVILAWITISGRPSFQPILVYIAAVLWTIGYDTIYAFQDIEDDLRVGVKSLAIKAGDNAINLIRSTYQVSVLCLFIVGLNTFMNWAFYILMFLAGYYLYWQVETLQVGNKKSAHQRFNASVLYGTLVLTAIWVGKI